MKRFRKIIFWLHLCIGVAAGVIIALLCITGAVLAFEKEFIAAAEKASITLEVDEGSERKEIDELIRIAQETEPDTAFSQIEIPADPNTAWILHAGRGHFRYLNPYTGEIWQSTAQGMRDFFHFNFLLHRWLTLEGASRDIGRQITGMANIGFLILCLSGLYLWFPRVWRWKAFRAVLLLKPKAKGKARDFNWHNVFGFWALIPLILMILTGSYFYYDWAKNGAELLLGPRPPRAGSQLSSTEPPPATQPQARLSMEARFNSAAQWTEAWDSIRMPITEPDKGHRGTGGLGGGGAAMGAPNGQGGAGPGANNGGRRRGPRADPAVVLVDESGHVFPYNRPSEIIVDLYSGEITAEKRAGDLNLRQKLHSSLRYIHTGEAGLLPGKIIAFLGCIAGLLLVYSGFTLSARRFLNYRKKRANP